MDNKNIKTLLLELLKNIIFIGIVEISLISLFSYIIQKNLLNNTWVFVVLTILIVFFLMTPFMIYLLTSRKIVKTHDNKLMLSLAFVVLGLSILFLIDPFTNKIQSMNTELVKVESCEKLCSIEEKEKIEMKSRTGLKIENNYKFSEIYLLTNVIVLGGILVSLKLKKEEAGEKEKK